MSTTPTENTATTTRRRHVLRGDGMTTPRKPVVIAGERLQPGRDRFSPDHPFVRAAPDAFAPAWSGDRHVQTRLRAQARVRRPAALKMRRRSWRLDAQPTGGSPSWQL